MEIIKVVEDNKDKQYTYQMQMGRYSKAVKEGFYLEAMMIDYAMMEDRLTAFLHYAGVITRRPDKKIKVNKKIRSSIMILLNKKEKEQIKISNISEKINIFRQMILLEQAQTDKYLDSVQQHIKNTSIDSEKAVLLCENISSWIDKRNQYVHALLNKKYYNDQSELKNFVHDGNSYCRELDNIVAAFKRKNNIRKINRIQ